MGPALYNVAVMKPIKAVLFDLDGTLADTLPLCIAAFRKAIEPLINRPVTDQEIVATFGPSEEGTIMKLAPNHYRQGLEDYLSFYMQLHTMCPEPFAGIRKAMDSLRAKGIHMSLVTGKGSKSTQISLNQFRLKEYFEFIETGWQHGPRKVDGLRNILDCIHPISRQEVIYVGDAPSDIVACREIGIPVIAAAWATTTDPSALVALNPDELFHTIEDFTGWVNKRI